DLLLYTASGFSRVLQISKVGLASRLMESINALDDAHNANAGVRETGVWFDFDKEKTPGFAMRIASIENRRFKKKYARLTFDAAQHSASDQLPSDKTQNILIEAMIGTILLDWRGLENDGKPFSYSEDNAREVLSQSGAIRDFV